MLVVVTYDVNTETPESRKRLRHVAKKCRNFGQRVQKSVFECLVDPAQWAQLRQSLIDEIDPEQDSFLPVLVSSVPWTGTRYKTL
jgi:CRISPR-associated protein Cas2